MQSMMSVKTVMVRQQGKEKTKIEADNKNKENMNRQ